MRVPSAILSRLVLLPKQQQPSAIRLYQGSSFLLGTALPRANNCHHHHHHHHASATALSIRFFSSSPSSSNGRNHMNNSNDGTAILNQLFSHRKDTLVGQDIPLAISSLATADCVCFDVDSTVINEEGIDVLAKHLGQGEQVAAMTTAAMEGDQKFQDALAARLELLQPSHDSILECLQQQPLQLTTGVAKLVQALQETGKDVYLVSGGFRIMIEPVADSLKIPRSNIIANTLLFHPDGSYKAFDPTEPTSADMGKPAALQKIQQWGHYHTMVMIGDGATDAQAKPPAATFIGFGGVAVREKVQQTADWFVTDFDDLTAVVQKYGANDEK